MSVRCAIPGVSKKELELTALLKHWLHIIFALLVGFILLYIATPFGIGINPDTHSYFTSASRVAAGDWSNFEGGSHYAPLYTLALAPFIGVGLELSVAAWLLSWICFSLSAFFFAKIVSEFQANASMFLSIGLFMALSGVLLTEVYTIALSESLFISFLLGGIYYFIRYLNSSDTFELVVATLLFACVTASRHGGIFLCPVTLVMILFSTGASFVKRLVIGLTVASCIFAPYMIWMLIHSDEASYAAGKSISFYPIGSKHLIAAVAEISKWLSPSAVAVKLRVFVLLVFLGLLTTALVMFHKKVKEMIFDKRLVFISMCAVGYLALLVVSVLFLTKEIIFYGRYLAILFPLLLILVRVLSDKFLPQRQWHRAFRVAGMTVILIVTISTSWTIIELHSDGAGYITRKWKDSPTVKFLTNSPTLPIYFSNKANHLGVIFHDRRFEHIPKMSEYLRSNENYQEDADAMFREVSQKCGWVVLYLDVSPDEKENSNLPFFVNDERYETVHTFSDGIILKTKIGCNMVGVNE
jgi:hypothetical protein